MYCQYMNCTDVIPAPWCSPALVPRLHGSYEALWAGQVDEALVDLSGGVAERWSLRLSEEAGEEVEEEQGEEEEKEKKGGTPPPARRSKELKLPQAVREGCAISCSLHNSTGGEKERGETTADNIPCKLILTIITTFCNLKDSTSRLSKTGRMYFLKCI